MNILKGVEKVLRWQWNKKGDPWCSIPLGHKLGTKHSQLGHLMT